MRVKFRQNINGTINWTRNHFLKTLSPCAD